MKQETPEYLQKKEKIWQILKTAIIEDLRSRSLDESEVGEIALQSKLIDLGLRDSSERFAHGFNWLNLVHVIDDLEQKLFIEIDHDRLLEFKTVEDIFWCLLRKVNRKEKVFTSRKK